VASIADAGGRGYLIETARSGAKRGVMPVEIKAIRERLHVEDADLTESHFSDVQLKGSRFENVSLQGALFSNVSLAGATITDANLSGVSITDANLEGMRINGILVSDLLKAYLRLRQVS
jgi:uncharacterized protein YjbI with pentapeptide repeats